MKCGGEKVEQYFRGEGGGGGTWSCTIALQLDSGCCLDRDEACDSSWERPAPLPAVPSSCTWPHDLGVNLPSPLPSFHPPLLTRPVRCGDVEPRALLAAKAPMPETDHRRFSLTDVVPRCRKRCSTSSWGWLLRQTTLSPPSASPSTWTLRATTTASSRPARTTLATGHPCLPTPW